MTPHAMLLDLLTLMRSRPSAFTFRDGFMLDELRTRERMGYALTERQEQEVEVLHSQYIEAAQMAQREVA